MAAAAPRCVGARSRAARARARLDVVEAALDAALEVVDLLEERRELEGLVAHRLAVLDRRLVQEVVELDRLVRGHAHLVLRRRLAEPEVDVPEELVRLLVLFGLEDDVRVPRVEVSIRVLGPRDDLEVLDAPDLEACVAETWGGGSRFLEGRAAARRRRRLRGSPEISSRQPRRRRDLRTHEAAFNSLRDRFPARRAVRAFRGADDTRNRQTRQARGPRRRRDPYVPRRVRARRGAGAGPRRLLGRGALSGDLVQFAADERHVAVRERAPVTRPRFWLEIERSHWLAAAGCDLCAAGEELFVL